MLTLVDWLRSKVAKVPYSHKSTSRHVWFETQVPGGKLMWFFHQCQYGVLEANCAPKLYQGRLRSSTEALQGRKLLLGPKR